MGTYVNPGNRGFSVIRNGKYVDKSGMIRLINDTLNTRQKLTCVSRPRRFGKSYAAQMLCAYYDRTCDSSSLFDDLEIADDPDYRRFLNRFDVIYLDVTGFISMRRSGGRDIGGIRSIYSPNSVMQAIENRDYDSYWSGSESYESLRQYIDIDFEGLQQDIIHMMGDMSLPVSTSSFQNDMTTIRGKDDVLTLLVHPGYLAYDEKDETVRIPNEKVRIQFADAARRHRSAKHGASHGGLYGWRWEETLPWGSVTCLREEDTQKRTLKRFRALLISSRMPSQLR